MKHTRLRLNQKELVHYLLPMVDGRVFHVTELSHLPAILESAHIEPNTDGALVTTFGYSSNSYFRKRGCVSVFDLRGARPDDALWQCSPFQPGLHGHGLAIFILAPATYEHVLPWTGWEDEHAWGEMVVPYVEGGHKGSIPLSSVDELIEVEVERNPDPLVDALRAARFCGRRG